ncbi:MAG: FxsA family protein [Spirochaetaceae bacterium]
MLLSLISLVFVGDIIFLIFLMQLVGTYLAFSLLFVFTAIGQIALYNSFSHLMDLISEAKDEAELSIDHYYTYAGTLPSVFYLIYPGILSTLIGFILLISPVRNKLGRKISRHFNLDWDEVREYRFLLT